MVRRSLLRILMKISALICVYGAAPLALGEGDSGWIKADIFRAGNLAAVKRDYQSLDSFCPECMWSAIASGNVELVKYLDKIGWFKKCAEPEAIGTCDDPISTTAHFGSVDVLRYLLSKGYAANTETLSIASHSGKFDQVTFLCRHGIDPSKDYTEYHADGKTRGVPVLERAKNILARSGGYAGDGLEDARRTASIAKSVDYIESGECKAAPKKAPYADEIYKSEVKAMRRGDVDAVRKSLEKRDAAKDNPRVQAYELYEAVASGNLTLLQYLKDVGWLNRCRKSAFCMPQHVSAKENVDIKILDYLISEGFGVDSYDLGNKGSSPLVYASFSGQLDKVKYLCQHGADYRNDSFFNFRYDSNPEPLLGLLRKPYNEAWCTLNLKELKDRASDGSVYKTDEIDSARMLCEDDGTPRDIRSLGCVPGAACYGLPFPPKGSEKDVNRIVALAEVFQYLRSGQCRTSKLEVCAARPSKHGTVIVDKINIRVAPNLQSEIVEMIGFGTPVDVTDYSRSCETVGDRVGRWIKISVAIYKGNTKVVREGWVFDAFIDYGQLYG